MESDIISMHACVHDRSPNLGREDNGSDNGVHQRGTWSFKA